MKKIWAFTLIETIIAISVFGIGILVVLHWVAQTLRNQDYAKWQIKSSFIAREWIELMYNLRDANYHKELPWNCIFNSKSKNLELKNENSNPFCIDTLKPWTVIKISIWSGDYIHIETSDKLWEDFSENFEKFQIYFHSWSSNRPFLYDYSWSEEESTWLARYILIKEVKDIPENNVLKIESHVLYQQWTKTWERVMETFMWNYEF